MGTIPKKIWPLIDGAFPHHTCLIGTVLPNGFAQITPRGSTQVYDGDHISLWERGRGSSTGLLADGGKATVFFFDLGAKDVLPIGGLARLYGTATAHKSGPVYDKVWDRLIEPEKKSDPEKKGWAVLIKIDRAEDLLGNPITD